VRRREQRPRAGGEAQAFGNGLQHTVAKIVPERVVDGFEVVEIDEQQCHALRVCRRTRERRGEPRRELAPIGQLRERIMMGEMV
jgi:hypothetical protein